METWCLCSLIHWDEFVNSLELHLHPLTEPSHWTSGNPKRQHGNPREMKHSQPEKLCPRVPAEAITRLLQDGKAE